MPQEHPSTQRRNQRDINSLGRFIVLSAVIPVFSLFIFYLLKKTQLEGRLSGASLDQFLAHCNHSMYQSINGPPEYTALRMHPEGGIFNYWDSLYEDGNMSVFIAARSLLNDEKTSKAIVQAIGPYFSNALNNDEISLVRVGLPSFSYEAWNAYTKTLEHFNFLVQASCIIQFAQMMGAGDCVAMSMTPVFNCLRSGECTGERFIFFNAVPIKEKNNTAHFVSMVASSQGHGPVICDPWNSFSAVAGAMKLPDFYHKMLAGHIEVTHTMDGMFPSMDVLNQLQENFPLSYLAILERMEQMQHSIFNGSVIKWGQCIATDLARQVVTLEEARGKKIRRRASDTKIFFVKNGSSCPVEGKLKAHVDSMIGDNTFDPLCFEKPACSLSFE